MQSVIVCCNTLLIVGEISVIRKIFKNFRENLIVDRKLLKHIQSDLE